jgi:hypothetical protein
VEIGVGCSIRIVPNDKDVAAKPGKSREAIGSMRSCHHEYARPSIAVRASPIELLECFLRRIRSVPFCLEHHAGTFKDALLREAKDEIALLATGAETGSLACDFDQAGRITNRAGDELGRRVFEVEPLRGVF